MRFCDEKKSVHKLQSIYCLNYPCDLESNVELPAHQEARKIIQFFVLKYISCVSLFVRENNFAFLLF